MSLADKEQALRRILAGAGRAAIAFSGGADSSLLLWLALDTLGPARVLVLTARSCLLPSRDLDRAATWPARHGQAGRVSHHFLDINPLAWDEFIHNPADRCYLCKSRVYRLFLEHAREQGVTVLLDGTNADDLESDRPGLQAIRELEIAIPLAAAGLRKEEVRTLSRDLGLDTWDAPSASCLATRIPAGLAITPDRLALIDMMESFLEHLGFAGCRVRLDSSQAATVCLQVQEKDLPRLAGAEERAVILNFFNDSGFKKVYVDLRGR